jgi:hypothetical protein
VAGCCECGDEPSGCGARELVTDVPTHYVHGERVVRSGIMHFLQQTKTQNTHKTNINVLQVHPSSRLLNDCLESH